jgi:DNA-binding response OmpR family regulator
MSPEPSAPILLYAEDEPVTQDLVRISLEEAGFGVITASDGAQALALLKTNGGVLRGLITDVDLGEGPDGWSLARAGRALVDNLPVVYVSGASDHDWSSKGVPNSQMISKPCAPIQIVVAISSLMAASDTNP